MKLGKIALVAASTLAGLCLAEGALRFYAWHKGIGRQNFRALLEQSRGAEMPKLTGGAGLFGIIEPSPYPNVVYQLKPLLHGIHRTQVLNTNHFGMRGPETEKAKPPRTFRIVGLGDSHMFGWGVAQQDTYLARLERLLNGHAADGWHFEVLNFGTPGYNTVMEVATFEHRALAFDPDYVLLHFVGNDLYPPHFMDPPRSLAPSSWYLVELIKALVAGARTPDTDGRRGIEDEAMDDRDEGVRRDRSEYAYLGGTEAFRRAIARLSELTAPRRIPVLLFQLGMGAESRQMAAATARAAGFAVLDAQPAFGEVLRSRHAESSPETFKRVFIGLDKHPSAAGHEAYALALFCQLQRLDFPHLHPTPELCRFLPQ